MPSCQVIASHGSCRRRSESNPEGWVPLVIAENKLANDLVLEKVEAVKDYPPWVMNYAG